MWVTLEDEFGVFERTGAVTGVARDASGFDEGGYGVGEIGEGADEALGFEVGGEFGPAFEAVFAGEDELGVGEGEVCRGDFGGREFVQAGMVAADALKRGGQS